MRPEVKPSDVQFGEYDCKLETKNIAFPGTSLWRLRIPRFHSVLCSLHKRSTNGAHELEMEWMPEAGPLEETPKGKTEPE